MQENDLGEVLNKYCKQIGASDAINYYNKFALKYLETKRHYDQKQYAKVADRYIGFMVYLNKK